MYEVIGLMPPEFSLERWLSLRETEAEINISESGIEAPALEELGVEVPKELKLSYVMTKGSKDLRSRISDLYRGVQVSPEEVLITNGAAEANFLVAAYLADANSEFIVQMPNYMQVNGILRWFGAKVVEWWLRPEEDFEVNLDSLASLINKRTRAIFISNPNNPTGKIIDEEKLKRLVEVQLDSEVILVFDEVYRGLELSGKEMKSLIEMADPSRSIVVSGLSKAYGLPGLRIGWIVANKELVNKFWSIKDYTTLCVTSLSDYLAREILREDIREKLLERGRRIVRRNLEILKKEFKREGIRLVEPEGGSFCIMGTGLRETLEFSEKLYQERGVLLVPGEVLKLPGFVRIGLGMREEEFREGVTRFLNFLDEWRVKTEINSE